MSNSIRHKTQTGNPESHWKLGAAKRTAVCKANRGYKGRHTAPAVEECSMTTGKSCCCSQDNGHKARGIHPSLPNMARLQQG